MEKMNFVAERVSDFTSKDGVPMVWWRLTGKGVEEIAKRTGYSGHAVKPDGSVWHATRLEYCADVPVRTTCALFQKKDGTWALALDKGVNKQLEMLANRGGAIGKATLELIFRNSGLDITAPKTPSTPPHVEEEKEETHDDEPLS